MLPFKKAADFADLQKYLQHSEQEAIVQCLTDLYEKNGSLRPSDILAGRRKITERNAIARIEAEKLLKSISEKGVSQPERIQIGVIIPQVLHEQKSRLYGNTVFRNLHYVVDTSCTESHINQSKIIQNAVTDFVLPKNVTTEGVLYEKIFV